MTAATGPGDARPGAAQTRPSPGRPGRPGPRPSRPGQRRPARWRYEQGPESPYQDGT
jgi:hypothetical protein